jgi:hypothetical protein
LLSDEFGTFADCWGGAARCLQQAIECFVCGELLNGLTLVLCNIYCAVVDRRIIYAGLFLRANPHSACLLEWSKNWILR